MKSVLDEGVPEDILASLRRLGADVEPFSAGMARLHERRLCWRRSSGLATQLLLTNDKNMGFQLNLRRLRVAIVALPITRPDVLSSRAADIFDTIANAKAGEVVSIGLDGRRVVRSAGAPGSPRHSTNSRDFRLSDSSRLYFCNVAPRVARIARAALKPLLNSGNDETAHAHSAHQ